MTRGKSTSSNATQSLNFSYGNPRSGRTRGVMILYCDDLELPVGRNNLVCVLGVPNRMTCADFCQFCGPFIHHVLNMQIVRNDDVEDKYSVLIRFDDKSSTDGFFHSFNGRRFSSNEVEVCEVLFTADVMYPGSFKHGQSSPASSAEQPSCPLCLGPLVDERSDKDMSGILTTICNHSFHCSCISELTDFSCPVCRNCQQQTKKCFVCQTSENLWICLVCGFVGCGRYKEGHATTHWKETQHGYSSELETERIWDHVGDNYIHSLIRSKADANLVGLSHYCGHADDGCGSCNCSVDPGYSEALLNRQVETIVKDYYNGLITSQLEKQKIYFESLLQEVEEETKRETSEEIEKAGRSDPKLRKMQAKLDECVKEKELFDELNKNVLKNLELLETKNMETEARTKEALSLKDEKIRALEEELGCLMASLDAPTTDETKGSNLRVSDSTKKKSVSVKKK